MVATPVQTTYVEGIRRALAGTIYGTDYETITGLVETAAGIGFGLPVGQGVADKGVVLAGASNKFIGVTVRDVTLIHATADLDKYVENENVGILRRGMIWVTASIAVAAGDAVHYDTTTGAWSNTGGATITNAKWVKSAGAGEVGLIYLSGIQKMA
jgi:hypothetical protein